MSKSQHQAATPKIARAAPAHSSAVRQDSQTFRLSCVAGGHDRVVRRTDLGHDLEAPTDDPTPEPPLYRFDCDVRGNVCH